MYSRIGLLVNIARFTWNEPSEMLRRVSRRLPPALRRRSGAWSGPKVNTGIVYVRDDDVVSTEVHLANYWTSSYGISPVQCELKLHDTEGGVRHGDNARIPDDGVLSIRCREIQVLSDSNRLEGTLAVRIAHERLAPGLSARGIVAYRGPRFAATHNYLNAVAEGRFKTAYAVVLPDHRAVAGSSLAIVNASAPRGAGSVARPSVSLYNASGRSITRSFLEVPPLGSRRMALGALFPEAENFVEEGPCGVRVTCSAPIGRPLVFEANASGDIVCMTEAATDFSAPTDVLTRGGRRRLDLGVTAPCLAIDADGMVTSYLLFNNYGFEEPYSVGFVLFDSDGKAVVELEEVAKLVPFGSIRISLDQILRRCRPDLSGAFRGYGIFFFPERRESRHYPISFCVFTELASGEWRACFTAGSDLFNPRRSFHGKPFSYRTRLFGPAQATGPGSMFFCLINTSTHRDYETEARPSMSLLSAQGQCADASTSVPPFGCRYFQIGNAFPSGEAILAEAGGRGWLRVRDLRVRLYGYFVGTDERGAVWASGLYGG